jgi:hypothetical protein
MKLNTKTIVAIAIVLFVLLTGGHFFFSSHQPTPPQPAMNPYGAFGPPAGAMPDMTKMAGDQAKIYQLMTQYGLDVSSATYLSQAKAQVLSQTNRSVHVLLTFPDGISSDQTITITPDVKYMPTAAELERAAKAGTHTYNVKFAVKSESDTKARMTLQYFVPYSAVPSELQRLIHDQSSSAHWFELVPSAWAQEGGGGGIGMNMFEETVLEAANAELGKLAEEGELSEKFPGPLKNLMLVLKALKKGMDLSDWMGELNELENCAENPTNPLTKKAYDQDPSYQDQVLNGVDEARAGAVESTAMRYMNLGVTSTIGKENEVLGVIITPLSVWSDETLKQLAEENIEDAKKSVTPCPDEPMRAGQFQPMKATLKYDYYSITLPRDECDRNGNCSHAEERRHFECTLLLKPDATGLLVGQSTAKLEMKSDSNAHGPNGEGGETSRESHETSKGDLVVEIRAGGATPRNGVVYSQIHTDTLTTDGTQKTGFLPTARYHNENGAWGIDCDFFKVNLDQGGTFKVFQSTDGHGTCTLELSPE